MDRQTEIEGWGTLIFVVINLLHKAIKTTIEIEFLFPPIWHETNEKQFNIKPAFHSEIKCVFFMILFGPVTNMCLPIAPDWRQTVTWFITEDFFFDR